MKKNLFNLLLLLGNIALLNACSTVNKVQPDKEADITISREKSSDCFIQKRDGSIVHFSSLKLVTGILITPHLLADGKIIIKSADITAYQNEDHYAISQEKLESSHRSKVAVDALPGFAVRIAKGSLNVYCKKYFNGAKAVDEVFLQYGDDGRILPYSEAYITR
ncbi:MAG TPA: hypothetical protein VLR49_16375, partial [Ferruginibacter sp.]|nr:hypothetical protein [Ferruginibacter sp.]